MRELALRRTAQRVDEQLLTHMQAHAIPGPWAAGERILVCIDEDPRSAALVRYARRLAERLQAPWTALHVETPAQLRSLRGSERDRIADTLRLGERLGGEAVTIPGAATWPMTSIAYAQANNVTHIVVGKPAARAGRDRARLRGPRVHPPGRRHQRSRHRGRRRASRSRRRPFGRSAEAKPRSSPSLWPRTAGRRGGAGHRPGRCSPSLDVENVALVFLTAVLAVAVRFGLWPSLFASPRGVAGFNFFFLPPLYTFTIADPDNVAALFFFASSPSIAATSRRASDAGDRGAPARRGPRRISTSSAASSRAWHARRPALGDGAPDRLDAQGAGRAPACRSRARSPCKAGYPPEDQLDEADLAAAKWALENNRPAGRGADTLPGAKRLFLPMRTGRGTVGVVGIDSDKPGPLLTPEQRRLLDALVDQAALAIERMHLVEDVDRAKLAAETDRLRSALLTSISHDLKTPLAAILGVGQQR